MGLVVITFNQLPNHQDGLVFLGCGGDHEEWIEGIQNALPEDSKNVFGPPSRLTTSGGRTDLVFPFKIGVEVPPLLPMWRLSFRDCSWISDYKVNYRNQHNDDEVHNDLVHDDDVHDAPLLISPQKKKKHRVSQREIRSLKK
jgi:hypothetical protein